MNKLKSIKKFIIISSVLVCVAIIVINQFIPNTSTKTQSPSNIIQTNNSVLDVNTTNPTPQFFMTRQNTKKEILDYTWIKDRLIIATASGISDAGLQNTSFSNNPIQEINFNSSGHGIFTNNGAVYYFDPLTRSSKQISVSGEKLAINGDGTLIASVLKSNEIILTRIEDQKVINSITLQSNIISITWAYNTDDLIVIHNEAGQNSVLELYDNNLESQYSTNLDSETSFLDINPSGTLLALKKSGTLVIRDLKYNIDRLVKVNEGATISGNWIANDTFILIESLYDHLERPIDIITNVNADGHTQNLTTSVAIPNKVNTSIKLKLDPTLNILPIIENKGVVWLLSMVPYTRPAYVGSTINLFPVDTSIKATDDGH